MQQLVRLGCGQCAAEHFDLRMCGSYAVVATRGIPEVTNSAEEAGQAQALIQGSAAARPVSRRQPGPVGR
jgi:hypothetical protein